MTSWDRRYAAAYHRLDDLPLGEYEKGTLPDSMGATPYGKGPAPEFG